jgi:pilus assembly protein CpaD
MISYVRLLAVGILAASAAGCTMPLSNGEEEGITPTANYPITVEPQVVTMAVMVDDGMQRLAPGEAERVRAFAERWKMRGEGMINAATPVGAENRSAALASLDEIKRILYGAGIEPNAVNISSYRADNTHRAPITLSFVTLSASASDCGMDWSENLGWSPRNMPWPEFGCTTQHNFAAVVANPRDLIEPRTSEPSDNARRSQILDNYRKGTVTAAQKTQDDSGNVSALPTASQ